MAIIRYLWSAGDTSGIWEIDTALTTQQEIDEKAALCERFIEIPESTRIESLRGFVGNTTTLDIDSSKDAVNLQADKVKAVKDFFDTKAKLHGFPDLSTALVFCGSTVGPWHSDAVSFEHRFNQTKSYLASKNSESMTVDDCLLEAETFWSTL